MSQQLDVCMGRVSCLEERVDIGSTFGETLSEGVGMYAFVD